jgi:hypothetical protein
MTAHQQTRLGTRASQPTVHARHVQGVAMALITYFKVGIGAMVA